MIKQILLSLLTFVYSGLYAQDSTKVLPEVEVQAYRYNKSPLEVPLSVGAVNQKDMQRFDNASFLPAVNAVPGVRMEERSPGSYRFSIRGSLLRSPFGVRNVKVYWHGLPFTDAGGNTYLNNIDPAAISAIEIIKGPGSSLYGANTGGVVLMNKKNTDSSLVDVSYTGGSYGLSKYYVKGRLTDSKKTASAGFYHQSSDGYRDHTRFARDAGNVDISFALSRSTTISATVIATDIFYETPGGLTKKEYDANATQARPSTPATKGAVEQNANVENKSIFGGISVLHDWNSKWSTETGVFTSYSDFQNFSIRNVENRYETNLGARLENDFNFGSAELGGKISFGGEFIYLKSPINVFDNNLGESGDVQVRDDLGSTQYLVFAQAAFVLPFDFNLTAGISSNYLKYDYERTFPNRDNEGKTFNAVVTPRIAVLKKLTDNNSVYASISSGFSPPTLAEVRPSTNVFNESLKPETGVNYELGLKSAYEKISFDVTAYHFNLRETIVLERVQDGAEVFTNAGETLQRGIEATIRWMPMHSLTFWSSYNFNHYRFKDYMKYDPATKTEIDFSGNKLTGVPPTVATIGIDGGWKRVGFHFTASYTDHIPLSDANNEFANEFLLMALRLSYRITWPRLAAEIFMGATNLLDEKYSLGNDLNAVNGRYYNVAPDRSFFGGVRFQMAQKH